MRAASAPTAACLTETVRTLHIQPWARHDARLAALCASQSWAWHDGCCAHYSPALEPLMCVQSIGPKTSTSPTGRASSRRGGWAAARRCGGASSWSQGTSCACSSSGRCVACLHLPRSPSASMTSPQISLLRRPSLPPLTAFAPSLDGLSLPFPMAFPDDRVCACSFWKAHSRSPASPASTATADETPPVEILHDAVLSTGESCSGSKSATYSSVGDCRCVISALLAPSRTFSDPLAPPRTSSHLLTRTPMWVATARADASTCVWTTWTRGGMQRLYAPSWPSTRRPTRAWTTRAVRLRSLAWAAGPQAWWRARRRWIWPDMPR